MRIKHTLLALLLTMAAAFRSEAQSLVLCESYDTYGTASGIYSTWDIPADGGYVYMLYKQNSNFSSGLWYLYIDYDWDKTGKLTAYETISLTPDQSKNWLVYDYKFKDVGNYRAYIMYNGVEMASVFFNIDYQAGAGPGTTTTTSTNTGEIDTYYYEDSEIVFATALDANNDPVDPSTVFTLPTTGAKELTVYCSNNLKPFTGTAIYVDIYKDGNTEPYDTFTITIQPEWDYVFFKVTFAAPGNYYVDLYNEDDIFINTATVTITR